MPIFIVLLGLAAAGWMGYMAAAGAQYSMVVLAASAAAALFAFLSPKLSLILLIFSMLLSPELGFGAVDPSRSLVVRYDDIFIVIIFMSWFIRAAITKNKPFITSTPVQTPVLLYTAVCLISTALGVMRGDLRWHAASLYTLKYVEYFLLYFMVINIVESEQEVKTYLKYGAVVAVIVTIYAYYYYYMSGIDARATAPFEVPINGDLRESEPASLGGYYLVVFGIMLGLISETAGLMPIVSLVLLCLAFPAFLFTYSRASYLGFAAMVPALLFFSRRRRLMLIGFLMAGGLAFMLAPAIKGKVIERITMTYKGRFATQAFDAALVGQVKLEESAAARVWSLRKTIYERLPKRPLLGWGVTGIGTGDTQYALVLGELGLIGAGLFIWMIYKLFFVARRVLAGYSDRVVRGVALGFLISLIGLLFQALGVNTFIVVRIMEPFWFVAALLNVLYLKIPPELKKEA